jgi:hypothetical protein
MNMGMDYGTDNDTDTDTDSDENADTETDTDMDANADIKTDTDPDIATDTEMDTDTDLDTDTGNVATSSLQGYLIDEAIIPFKTVNLSNKATISIASKHIVLKRLLLRRRMSD